MPCHPQKAVRPCDGDLQADHGKGRDDWNPRFLDIDHDMVHLKDFVLDNKKVIVVGGDYAPPLSNSAINQIMCGGDKAWEGMAPRKMQMIQIFKHTMGGEKAAKMFHFGHVDHAATSRELVEGCDASLNAPQPSADELSKLAKNVTRQTTFMNADVLVINYDDPFIIKTDPSSFDNFISYIIRRVERAIDAIEALIKAAVPKMRKAGRIVVLINSLWTLALIESTYHDHVLLSKNGALMMLLIQEVMEKYGIEVSFHQNSIASNVRPINWPALCNIINHFACDGYTLDMQRCVGTRIAAVAACGRHGPTRQEADVIYDRVLSAMIHARCFSDFEVQERHVWERSDMMMRCYAERYGVEYGPKNVPGSTDKRYGDPDLYGACLRKLQDMVVTPQQSSRYETGSDETIVLPKWPKRDNTLYDFALEPVPYVEGTTKIWRAKFDEEKAFTSKVALVLDTGRYDGVTTHVCQELARLGAKVVVTYVNNGDDAATVKELVEKIRLDGGEAAALEGVPHRSADYSDKLEEQDSYVRELVLRALRVFQAKKFDIIVNNAGRCYSLKGRTLLEKKELIYADSVRNMLAIHYVLEVCDECDVLSHDARVINIAGMGTNAATAVDHLPFWDQATIFAHYWSHKFNHPSRTVNAYATFNTFAPAPAIDTDFSPFNRNQQDLWWKNVEEFREKYMSRDMVEETARLLGLLARPTTTLHALVVMPDFKK